MSNVVELPQSTKPSFKPIFREDHYLVNPKYDEKTTKPFTKSEIIEIYDQYMLFGSIGDVEFSWELITDLLEFYNIESEEDLTPLFLSVGIVKC